MNNPVYMQPLPRPHKQQKNLEVVTDPQRFGEKGDAFFHPSPHLVRKYQRKVAKGQDIEEDTHGIEVRRFSVDNDAMYDPLKATPLRFHRGLSTEGFRLVRTIK